jgi:hypothetical protein
MCRANSAAEMAPRVTNKIRTFSAFPLYPLVPPKSRLVTPSTEPVNTVLRPRQKPGLPVSARGLGKSLYFFQKTLAFFDKESNLLVSIKKEDEGVSGGEGGSICPRGAR